MTPRHYKPLEIIRARAGLLKPGETRTILRHCEGCDGCFVNLLRYVEDHYQEAKEYLAFGLQKELGLPAPAFRPIPDDLEAELAQVRSPLTHELTQLKRVLSKLHLLDAAGARALGHLRRKLAQVEKKEGKLSTLIPPASLSYVLAGAFGGCLQIVPRMKANYRRIPQRARRLLAAGSKRRREAKWTWRAAAACLPPNIANVPNKHDAQKRIVMDLERAGILMRIICQRLKGSIHGRDPLAAEMQHNISLLLHICAVAIAKYEDLGYVEHIRRKLRAAFGQLGVKARLRQMRSRARGLWPPRDFAAGGPAGSACPAWLRGWDRLFALPGAGCLVPDILGELQVGPRRLRVMAEVKHYFRAPDVHMARALLGAAGVDRAILISRLPLGPLGKYVASDSRLHTVPSGKRRLLLVEWDKALDAFTAFCPGDSFRALI